MREALEALRDADRLLHVARTTHAREVVEAMHERRVGVRIALGAEVPGRLLGGTTNDEDAVGAERDVGEAIVALKRAIAALPEAAPGRARLVGSLGARRGGIVPHIDSLHAAVRAAYAENKTRDAPPLPDWDTVDPEDVALAKAAGATMSPVVRGLIVAAALLIVLGPRIYGWVFE